MGFTLKRKVNRNIVHTNVEVWCLVIIKITVHVGDYAYQDNLPTL